ncbi:S-adenosylmethionine decarboxylase proenzyme [bacterium]|nr:S-adenosylmethionine decarboxylase proenzyme [bacterium]
MNFDGPEKKCELSLVADKKSLRSLDYGFWEKIVQYARAQILSHVKNEHCDAYLLSESSLFVYDHKCLMITCGQTDLAKAMNELIFFLDKDDINQFIYERKIGHFPEQHPYQIEDDYKLLSNHFKLERKIFNQEENSPIHFFSYEKPSFEAEEDGTIEILMHDLNPEVFSLFSYDQKNNFQDSNAYQEIKKLLHGFTIDEYFFDPCGYSLNAIKENEYATIHVTPQKVGSYVSFETNMLHRGERLNQIILDCVEIFQSNTFDVVVFDTKAINWKSKLSDSYSIENQQEHLIQSQYHLMCRRYIKSKIK